MFDGAIWLHRQRTGQAMNAEHDKGFIKGIWFTVLVQTFILVACKVVL